jgi:hypothetical protein
VVQVQPLPLQAVCYFFLAGAFFFAVFAAGLAVDRPGLWALQVLHIFVTSLPVLWQNYINYFALLPTWVANGNRINLTRLGYTSEVFISY